MRCPGFGAGDCNLTATPGAKGRFGHRRRAARCLQSAPIVRASAIAVAFALAGCLAVPPSPRDESMGTEPDAAAGDPGPVDGGGQVDDCLPGSRLDLAYVNRIGIAEGHATVLSLVDIAMFVNPGPDTLDTRRLSAAVRRAAGLTASASLTARDDHLSLPPGQAHGSLDIDYAAAVLPYVDEEWTDYAYPALVAELAFDGPLFDEREVVLELEVDGQRFEAPVTLVPAGAPVGVVALDAVRLSASCPD